MTRTKLKRCSRHCFTKSRSTSSRSRCWKRSIDVLEAHTLECTLQQDLLRNGYRRLISVSIPPGGPPNRLVRNRGFDVCLGQGPVCPNHCLTRQQASRSEERRVGKECRARGSP